MKIAVCICTRKRPDGLKRLLESISVMHIPDGTDLKVVVVENDKEKFSESIVNDFVSSGRLNISYHLETKPGIVFARNRSVFEAGDCDFVCFTDDDEWVEPTWVEELVRCQKEFDCDGVAGPTMPVFTITLPEYIKSFHLPKSYSYGTVVRSAFTGNLMLRKRYLDMLEGPFDARLNFSGGEDSFLTGAITKLGAVIRYNPEAVASEYLPLNRSTFGYMLRRKFRTANTELIIRSINEKSFTKYKALPRLFLRFLNGLLISVPCLLFGGNDRFRGVLKMANAVGGFAFVFGRQTQFYK